MVKIVPQYAVPGRDYTPLYDYDYVAEALGACSLADADENEFLLDSFEDLEVLEDVACYLDDEEFGGSMDESDFSAWE